MRWVGLMGLLAMAVVALAACASPTPTPTATPTPSPTPAPDYPIGPSVVVYDQLLVSLIAPEQVKVGDIVEFSLAFANIGEEAITFYHQQNVSEFVFLKDGEQVMDSYDQLIFPQAINYTNTLGPHMTRREETGFMVPVFQGVLIDKQKQPLPPGTYEVYGIAHISDVDDGVYQAYETPKATFEIVP